MKFQKKEMLKVAVTFLLLFLFFELLQASQVLEGPRDGWVGLFLGGKAKERKIG